MSESDRNAPHTPEQTDNNLYACIAGGSPDESECVIVRGNAGIRSWVHQALFSGRWDEAPQDVRDLRESAVDPDEWEDDHWSARFEDGWLNIRPVTRIEREVHIPEPEQTGPKWNTHRWVDRDGSGASMCADCGVDLDDDESADLCPARRAPEQTKGPKRGPANSNGDFYGLCPKCERSLEEHFTLYCPDCDTPEQTETCHCNSERQTYIGAGPDPLCQMCDGTGRCPVDEADEPAQTGDALASYERILRTAWFADADGSLEVPESMKPDDNAVRRYLTASGVPEEVGSVIYSALQAYRLQHQVDGDGGHTLGLIDALTPEWAKDVSEGEDELRLLADHVYNKVRAISGEPYVPEAVRRLPSQWRRSPPKNVDACAYEIEQVLASAPAGGGKLVPAEPTPEMISAGVDARRRKRMQTKRDAAIDTYRTMIAAAPQRGGE